jgi:hypothetical protein
LVRVFHWPTNETGRSISPERPFWWRPHARSGVNVTAFGSRRIPRQKALTEKTGKNEKQACYCDTLHTHFPMPHLPKSEFRRHN